MKRKSIGIVTFCFVTLLIANFIPTSYADSSNQNLKQQKISIIGCTTKGSCVSSCQVTILKGDTITWINTDSKSHMIVSGSSQNGPDGWFSSLMIPLHGTFSHKFDRRGAFSYYDILHPNIEGVIIVGSSLDSSYVHLYQKYFSNWCDR